MIRLKDLLSEATLDTNPLDGKSKTNAKNWVLTKANKLTKGMFGDEYWHGPNSIWKEFDKIGLNWNMTGNKYEHEDVTLSDGSRANVPVRKIWTFEVRFVNNNDKEDSLFGRVVAAGAGPIDNPLDKYDIVVTLS